MNKQKTRCVYSLYLSLAAVIMPILPRHGAPAAGLPQHSHPLHFPLTPSSHSWMPETHACTGPLRTRVHTHTHTHVHLRSDAFAKRNYEGVAEGSLIELESKMLRSFGCTRMQQCLFTCLRLSFVLQNAGLSVPFFALMTTLQNQLYMQDTSRFWLLFFQKHARSQT